MNPAQDFLIEGPAGERKSLSDAIIARGGPKELIALIADQANSLEVKVLIYFFYFVNVSGSR